MVLDKEQLDALKKMEDFAENSNPIYGASDTVQPPAFVVNIWRRVA